MDSASMQASYLNNGEGLVRSGLKMVDEEISEPNRSYVLDYVRQMRLDNKNLRTIGRHLRELRFIFKVIGKKDAKKVEESDIERVILAVNGCDKAAISKKKILFALRIFFKFLYKTEGYPPIVRKVKPKRAESKRKTPEEMITQEELMKLVEVSDSQLEKTLIMFLFCSVARVGEVLNLKISDLQLSDSNTLSFVKLDGKTGKRMTPLLAEAVPYLRNYVNTERRGAQHGDNLFMWKGRILDYDDVRFILQKLSNKAKLSKRLHSHLFRHSLSSYLASKGMQESQMSLFFGYSPIMASYYTHLSNVNDTIAKLNGIPSKENMVARSLLNPKVCERCNFENEFSAKLCSKCMNEFGQNVNDNIQSLKQEVNDLKGAINMLVGSLDLQTREKIMELLKKN